MWLLDAVTKTLERFVDERVEPYAILSHTWGHGEVTFQDIHNGYAGNREGYRKIQQTCDQALQDGLAYVWIDTCCINKESSAELSEAINSMFRWYSAATRCYVQLSDALEAVRWYEQASALIAMRGAKQFESATGGLLFIQACTNLLIGCAQHRAPIPEHIRAMSVVAAKHVPDPTDRAWMFFIVQLRYTDLYAKLRPGNFVYSPEDAPAILQEAMAVEDDLIALTLDPARDWQYEVVEATGPSVFAGYCHIFPTFLYAQIWTAIMSFRMQLTDIMVKAVQALQYLRSVELPAGAEERVRNAVQTLTNMQLHVFASVPQHLGTDPGQPSQASFPNVETPSSKGVLDDTIWRHFKVKDCSPWRTRPKRSPDLPFVRMSGGFLIQWMLFQAGQAGRPGSKSRTFAIQMLKHIGQRLGLQQGLVLANTLEEDSGVKFGLFSSL